VNWLDSLVALQCSTCWKYGSTTRQLRWYSVLIWAEQPISTTTVSILNIRKVSAGFVSKLMTIRQSIEEGMQYYDFLGGDEHYKFQLGGVEEKLASVRYTTGLLRSGCRAATIVEAKLQCSLLVLIRHMGEASARIFNEKTAYCSAQYTFESHWTCWQKGHRRDEHLCKGAEPLARRKRTPC
jgi:hypothetical protein